MADRKHSLCYNADGVLDIYGVTGVTEVNSKQAEFATDAGKLTVKGSGFNVVKMDKAEGYVRLETESVSSITYQGGAGKPSFKSLFR